MEGIRLIMDFTGAAASSSADRATPVRPSTQAFEETVQDEGALTPPVKPPTGRNKRWKFKKPVVPVAGAEEESVDAFFIRNPAAKSCTRSGRRIGGRLR